MSKDAWLTAAGDEEGFGNGTVFFTPANSGRFINGGLTEAQLQDKVKAGTLDKGRMFVSASSGTAQFGMGDRINGVNGAIFSSQTAGATGEFEDTTHSDSVVDGDLLVVRGTGTVVAQTTTISGQSGFHYLATANITTVGGCVGNGVMNATALATTYFGTMLGGYHASILGTTEANCKQRVRAPATMSLFRVSVTSNSLGAPGATYTLRKNAANGNGTAAYAAGATGIVEDGTHTDTSASADLVNWQVTTPSTANSIQASLVVVVIVGSNQQIDACTECTSGQGSTTVSHFLQLVGFGGTIATEANRQHRFRWASSTNNFRINTTSNASTGFSWFMRLNGTDGTQTVTQGSSATGYVEDVTHKDAVASGDLVNYRMGTVSTASTQSNVEVTVGTTSNNAAIGTVFGTFSQVLSATVQDVTHIATVFGQFSQAAAVDVEATFRGPIATVFGTFSQVVVAQDIGVRGTGIRRFWTF